MLIALLVAASQVAGAVGGQLYTPEAQPAAFGVNASFYKAAPGQAGPMLDAMLRGGLDTVREGRGGNWAVVEPDPPVGGAHRYQWSTPDRVQEGLAAHGLRWYAFIGLTPAWDAAAPNGPPKDPRAVRDFASYARAFARRYGRAGSFWRSHPALPYLPVTDYELANEPNGPPQLGSWSPARLAEITAAAGAAIRSVDPRATVIPAAFSQIGDPGADDQDAGSWVRAMLTHDPGLRIDAVGLNLYRGFGGSNGVPAFERTLRGVRAELRSAGAGAAPIDVDEIGWVTGPNPYGVTPVSEAQRAANLREIAERWPQSNCGIRVIQPFIWSEGIGNPGEVPRGFELFTGDQGDDPTRSGAAYTYAVVRQTGSGWLPPLRRRPRIC